MMLTGFVSFVGTWGAVQVCMVSLNQVDLPFHFGRPFGHWNYQVYVTFMSTLAQWAMH